MTALALISKHLLKVLFLEVIPLMRIKSKKDPLKIEKITICLEDYSRTDVSMETATKALRSATAVAEATNFAKAIVNATPEDMTPIALADVAQTLTSIPNVTCKVMDENFLKAQGMNAFLAVNRASVHPPRLIHLTYKPENAKNVWFMLAKA